jgi:hypothetical protein
MLMACCSMDVSFLQPNGPYALDLSLEHDVVVLQQLVAIDAREREALPDEKKGFFEQIALNGTPSRMSSSEFCRWVDGRRYPHTGILSFNFVCRPFAPLMLDECDAKSFNGILAQVAHLIRIDDSLTASIVVSAFCSNFVFSEAQALALLACFPSTTGRPSLHAEPGCYEILHGRNSQAPELVVCCRELPSGGAKQLALQHGQQVWIACARAIDALLTAAAYSSNGSVACLLRPATSYGALVTRPSEQG